MLPLATTTISVLRQPGQTEGEWRDPTDAPLDPVTVASGIRAHISVSSGVEDVAAGASQERILFRLHCDPFDAGIHHEDTVVDDTTGETFEVVWSHAIYALDLDHIEAGIRQVTGVVGATARRF
jgi:hypothetical protein